MHEAFRAFTENLHPKFEALMAQEPVIDGILPSQIRGSGVYLFTENGSSLYVGRTRNVRARYGQHTRRSSGHNSAPFAFKLARHATGFLKSDYKPGATSREGLLLDPEFAAAFATALERVRGMEFRFVEESDPTRQCLLEVYVSVVCGSPYNDFNTTYYEGISEPQDVFCSTKPSWQGGRWAPPLHPPGRGSFRALNPFQSQ